MSANFAPTWIGAIAAITESPLPLNVYADGPCRVAIIPRQQFIDLSLRYPTVHQKVMHVIGPVMRGVNAREANRERLTSLGTMAAGLAHELNNPAAAARRAASRPRRRGRDHQPRAARVRGERHRAHRRGEAAQAPAGGARDVHGARARSTRSTRPTPRTRCSTRSRTAGSRTPGASPSRSRPSGLDADWVDRVQAIAGPATGKTLAWVAASLTAHELATELVESTERMSGLVKAIKTYAYMDRGGVVQADVHEGIESTLVMLGHKLKHTQIKVKRDYDKTLPQLMMYGSELNQVWTNLLDNAIGVLGEDGAIKITTSADNGCIKVDIADDGPGIPEEARTHIFDPFFTTKAPGSGTGMGLDTARRIVEQRHRGSITFDTGEGGTVFHVWLPLDGVKK